MGSIQPHELSLNCKPTFIPLTISEFLIQVSMIKNVKERQLKIDEYIARLDDEMKKIDAFKRELPLSMLLLNDAIVAVKEEAMQCRKLIAEPIFEQFIPLKKNCVEDDKKVEVRKEKDNKEKKNWLSMQLCSSDQHCSNLNFSDCKERPKPEPVQRAEEGVSNVLASSPFKSSGNSQSMGTVFVPLQGYTGFPLISGRKEEKEKLAGVSGLSLRTPGSKSPDDDIVSNGLNSKIIVNRVGSSSASTGQSSLLPVPQPQQQKTTRKQRRCWSPELHCRFVEALQQLGGSQVATPKQIRELMQVDGLTNDEVKSHLQKYRLHTRRLSTTSASNTEKSALLRWNPQDHHYGESSSKQSNSQSASPQDPLQFGGASRATSMTGGDSMEDEDDNKSESYSWKSHVQSSEKSNV